MELLPSEIGRQGVVALFLLFVCGWYDWETVVEGFSLFFFSVNDVLPHAWVTQTST